MVRAREDTALPDHLTDLLRPLGTIRVRRMFGGHGIYADGLFFALIVDDDLYFKTDAISRPVFVAAGLEEWVYVKRGKPVRMRYFRPPEDVYEDVESLRHWGGLALDAARRAGEPRTRAARRRTP
jgi:DNA transformation protein and related proteins